MKVTDYFKLSGASAYFPLRAPFRASRTALLKHASALERSDRQRAFKVYARLAQVGQAEAQYKLGRCYLEGKGVPPSSTEAVHWLRMASQSGFGAAQAVLAELYLQGAVCRTTSGVWADAAATTPDYVNALHFARAAADNGSAEGQALLATILLSGPDELRRPDEAQSWFKRSADAGCPGGMLGYGLALAHAGDDTAVRRTAAAYVIKAAEYELPAALNFAGMIFGDGFGVAKDDAKAAHYFRRAAAKGTQLGRLRWGLALVHGVGVHADPIEGQSWLQRAAVAGDLEAALVLCDLAANEPESFAQEIDAAGEVAWLPEGTRKAAARAVGQSFLSGTRGYPRDVGRAVKWLKVASASGDAGALHVLADAVFRGFGTPQDRTYLLHAFERAATTGDPAAGFNLAVCLARGIGTPRDDQRAAFWLAKAAEDLAVAQYWYGQILLAGRGIAPDALAGWAWIARAAQNGSPVAAQALARRALAPSGAERAAVSNSAAQRALEPNRQPGQTCQAGDLPDLSDPSPSATAVTDKERADMEVSQPHREAPDHSDVAGTSAPAALCDCGSGLSCGRCCQMDVGYAASSWAVEQSTEAVDLAAKAFAAGDVARAERLCIEALERTPRHVRALAILQQIRHRAGHDRAAAVLLERLLAIDPNNVAATQQMALHAFLKGDLDAAEGHARNAVRLAPSDPRSHNLMGMILTEAQRPRIGEYHYRRVLDLSPQRDPIVLANLAWNLKGQGRLAEARQLYEESTIVEPNVFQTLFGWAQLEEADRNFAVAASLLDRAEALRADDPGVMIARANLLGRKGQDEAALAQFNGVADSAADSNLLLNKGRVLDRLARFDEAFACFTEAKFRLRTSTGKSYREQHARDIAERLRGFFTSGRLANLPPSAPRRKGPQPLFILGFPRSGTTLMEQILCGHPRISAGDELPFINELSDTIPRLLGSPCAYPEALSELWMGDGRRGLEALRDDYLRKAEDWGVADHEKSWFTDKMPLNEMHLGLISLLFPQSPLIHVLRHPLDAVLSTFSHQMTHGYYCAYALESTARHYVLTMDTVQHYLGVMQPNYIAVRYEDLVADVRGTTRKILDFAGETFDEGCINFQNNKRLPNTPSYQQVSEKLYDRSLNRHRRYMHHLAPILPILQPVIDRLGYTVH